jgi:hypothetical protein
MTNKNKIVILKVDETTLHEFDFISKRLELNYNEIVSNALSLYYFKIIEICTNDKIINKK